MSVLHYEIAPEIFQRFPGYVRGVVVALGASNGLAPEALVAMLLEAERSVRGRLSAVGYNFGDVFGALLSRSW